MVMKRMLTKDVKITDSFWGAWQKTVRRHSIPYSWEFVDGSIKEMEAVVSGSGQQDPRNQMWMEANLYKVMETAGYALGQERNADLDAKIDALTALIGRAQKPDGYIHVHHQLRGAAPWETPYNDHNEYVMGHLLEAAAAHFESTGKRNLLEVACKAADSVYDHFSTRGNQGFGGHAEMELALVDLFRATGNRKYLELSREFIERRGQHPGTIPLFPGMKEPFPPEYYQDIPLREQNEIMGHAVRGVFFASGVAEVALETGDADYRAAALRLWESSVKRKLYIHGGIGSSYKAEDSGRCHSTRWPTAAPPCRKSGWSSRVCGCRLASSVVVCIANMPEAGRSLNSRSGGASPSGAVRFFKPFHAHAGCSKLTN